VNIEKYISSGILESYVLGELSEKECAEVENNLRQYPELRNELARIEDTQEALLMASAAEPRPAVKKKLMAKLDAISPAPRIVKFSRPEPGISFWKLAVAASVSIAIASSYLAYDYRQKWRKTESTLSDLIAQNQRVAEDYNTVNQRLDKIEDDLRIVNHPDFSRVVMKGTPNAPQALAAVYWNESTQEIYLSIQDMKQLTADAQYQLWAIIDGKPVDAGVFDNDFSGLRKMKEIGSAPSMFAVTIEPRGGRETPTLETMQVAGYVGKS
jgi:anti-sigma-K factor RskA